MYFTFTSPPPSSIRESQPSRGVKFYLIVRCEMIKSVESSDETVKAWFTSQPTTVMDGNFLTLAPHTAAIDQKVDEYIRKGMLWINVEINSRA